jgi:hypothetical protein
MFNYLHCVSGKTKNIKTPKQNSDELNLARRQVKRHGRVLKMTLVRAIAEGFIFGKSAAANAHHGAAVEAVGLALGIHDFELAFHAERAIVVDSQLDHFRGD